MANLQNMALGDVFSFSNSNSIILSQGMSFSKNLGLDYYIDYNTFDEHITNIEEILNKTSNITKVFNYIYQLEE